MKLFVVLFALVALCAAVSIPAVPGDNRHYVEGQSQYIWIPDGNGVPHLQNLKAPINFSVLFGRNGANNEYWLYTRLNLHNHQMLIHGNANSVRNSNYCSDLPLKVIVHGWKSDGNSAINPAIAIAFLNRQNCNVIVVDWHSLASSNYISASWGIHGVGEYLGNFLLWLHSTTGMDLNQVHLVGFSLGAHIVGIAGRKCNGRISRITGLDPAGPLIVGTSVAINITAAQYVEIIHTDSGLLGFPNNNGHADFYPNGGKSPQPGCWVLSSCSHSRSYEYFASSVQTDHFIGRQCASQTQAHNNQCTGNHLNMGNDILNKRGYGIFGLITGNSWPF